MPLSWIDILFLVTVALLVFNGLRTGAIFSLVNLVGIPLGLLVAYLFGPRLTVLLNVSPFISYILLFFGVVLVLHVVGSIVRGTVRAIPVIGFGDSLIGGLIGFGEAWLLWLFLLIVLGSFLSAVQQGTNFGGLNIQIAQLQDWHNFYNEAVTNSIFARLNGAFVKVLPNLPHLPQ